MTNYIEFKNLNKNQVKLLTILEDEFEDFPFYDDEDQNWDKIIILGTFYQEFMALCTAVASWYNRQRDKRDVHYACWPDDYGSHSNVLSTITRKYGDYFEEDVEVYNHNKDFFNSVNLEWKPIYGE